MSNASLEVTHENDVYHITIHYASDDVGKLIFLNCLHEESALNYLHQVTPNPVVGPNELIGQNIEGTLLSYDGKFNATTVSLNLSSTSLNIAYGKKCANLDLLNLEVYPLSSEILDPKHYFTKHFQ